MKMHLQDLASGQGNIGTPLRDRIDSQDSRMGGFKLLQPEEPLMQGRSDCNNFQSPNVRGKLQANADLAYGIGSSMTSMAASNIRINQIAENRIQFLTP